MAGTNKIAGFEWDKGNRDKCRKHGVSVPEIESLFDEGRPVLILPDAAHSRGERRLRAIGRSRTGRYVFIVFTVRKNEGRDYVRPISARYMHRREIENYEKQQGLYEAKEEEEDSDV